MDKPDKVEATRVSESKTGNNDLFVKGGPGGPGRPPGSKPKSFIDMERIRQEIVSSWNDPAVDGPRKMVLLAKHDFVLYLRALSWFMPKGAQVQINMPMFVTADPALHSEASTKFIDSIEKRADGGMPSPGMVLAALKEASPKNGKANGRAKRKESNGKR